MGYKIKLISIILLLFATVKVSAQCDQWKITAKVDSSTCAANGRITTTLTGVGNITGILYSLEPLVSGGYNISPNTSPVFENIPAGRYRIVVQGVCNAASVSTFKDTIVPGNYVPFTGAVTPRRATLHSCNYGQANVTVANGKKPYTIVITSAPASYTGRTTFTSSSNFIMDSLWGGSYTLTMTDACGAMANTQTLAITELGLMPWNAFTMQTITAAGDNCNKLLIRGPYVSGSAYNPFSSVLTYCVSYNNGPRSNYRPLSELDTVTLPAGQMFGNAYGKRINYYIKTPCGEELEYPASVDVPYLYNGQTINCNTDFDDSYFLVDNAPLCYPLSIKVTNTETNAVRYDTIKTSGQETHTMSHLPFGSYTLSAVTKDGYALEVEPFTVRPSANVNPYLISTGHYQGDYGNEGAADFYITSSVSNLSVGTVVTLISPSKYTYSYTIPEDHNSSYLHITYPTNYNSQPYFYPDTYVFQITDQCGTYYDTVVVKDSDVYHYKWSYVTEQTCNGLKVTPSGTALFNNDSSLNVYFKIMSGPAGSGYSTAVIAEGKSLLLPIPGQYKIGISARSNSVQNYTLNLQTVNFVYKPLIIDVNHSLGWVCPGQPANSGSIVAVAINGSKAATGVYTYRLAAVGKGATGPYLASNTTGKFSTATSGGAYTLTKNENYDIRVEDECGAAAVQTIKIIDFATAQVAFSDKPEYCVGDDVHFSIINLPTTAVQYAWTGPDGFTSTEQNPVLSNIKPTGGGNYHVVINADICEQSINGNVSISIAPYITTCYSAVTDTSVNPYVYGLLGNWHSTRTYTYYGPRAQSDPDQSTDIRHDGAFADFISFWELQNNKWKANKDTSRWVWNAQTTLFNSKGYELENSDPLGRYNAGIYGYGDALPVAVIKNSRFREAAFDGFEDYGSEKNTCDTTCSSDRRFDFSAYKNNIDSTEKHTGKYSIRVQPGDTVGVISPVTDSEAAFTEPVFNKGTNSCSPSPVLKSVRADKGLILPSFSPLAGKKILFSAWVKETQDCKCSSYVSNKITLAMTNRDGNTNIVNATPVGGIIEGWQRYEQVIELRAGATGLSIVLLATGTATAYFDDIRIHPYNANMQSFVYDAQNLRLMAELDENNYATFYEYDDDGSLTRMKKETEEGIKTIKETRSALIKQ